MTEEKTKNSSQILSGRNRNIFQCVSILQHPSLSSILPSTVGVLPPCLKLKHGHPTWNRISDQIKDKTRTARNPTAVPVVGLILCEDEDINGEQLSQLYRELLTSCWSNKHNFMVIDWNRCFISMRVFPYWCLLDSDVLGFNPRTQLLFKIQTILLFPQGIFLPIAQDKRKK